MREESLVLKREDLYEKVWKEPMSRLANSYGLSDVGLKKICKKLKIPTPERGHWARLRVGKEILKPELPPLAAWEESEVQRTKEVEPDIPAEDKVNIEERIALEDLPGNRIVVPVRVGRFHRLVKQTRQALQGRGADEWDRVHAYKEKYLSIAVSKKSLPRALRLMDTLIKALESRNCSVRIVGGETQKTEVSILGEVLSISMEERAEAKENELSKWQQKEKEKYPWQYRDTIYVGSGRLMLMFDGPGLRGIRQRWRDTKLRRLEDFLNPFVAGLFRGAMYARAWRLEREERERERVIQHQKEMEEERQRWLEKQRVDVLDDRIQAWKRVVHVRGYLQDLKAAAGPEPKQLFARWMCWVEDYATRLDENWKSLPVNVPLPEENGS